MNLVTRLAPFDFRHEAIDAAVHFGREDWPGADMVLLRRETVLPVCSPVLRDQYRFTEAATLRAAPLLHLTTRPDAWEQWLRQHGVDERNVYGMLFDQFATLAQAAIAGLGVAFIPPFLIEEELGAGKLVPAIDLPMRMEEAYYLCWPLERAEHPPLIAFRKWLLAETAPDR
jgi:LysR family glycine cleavage system transcriptional activator